MEYKYFAINYYYYNPYYNLDMNKVSTKYMMNGLVDGKIVIYTMHPNISGDVQSFTLTKGE